MTTPMTKVALAKALGITSRMVANYVDVALMHQDYKAQVPTFNGEVVFGAALNNYQAWVVSKMLRLVRLRRGYTLKSFTLDFYNRTGTYSEFTYAEFEKHYPLYTQNTNTTNTTNTKETEQWTLKHLQPHAV